MSHFKLLWRVTQGELMYYTSSTCLCCRFPSKRFDFRSGHFTFYFEVMKFHFWCTEITHARSITNVKNKFLFYKNTPILNIPLREHPFTITAPNAPLFKLFLPVSQNAAFVSFIHLPRSRAIDNHNMSSPRYVCFAIPYNKSFRSEIYQLSTLDYRLILSKIPLKHQTF
ncbi:uncharacterized protein LALA0_S13e02828g [Lachancea lanzarotensis]|uniref:LALA0S13e02828g1_1 n=1 Tax=Lachancea lanzarotensis TaxID=1245769 RepID=A0A0C7MXP7_9SACH|nr:uncharacterized protein LALA0_S13e02828g [Lachancea lanzarotensis]CEP64779.1 LALA0S13e02828g1_1 [Lachancea lanzarotensis]